ncbi:hypothetical protein BO82DRAFT_275514, partial [Aspergillus uvarum CBS 121591]
AHTTIGCGKQGFPSAQPYLSHTPGANPFCCMFLLLAFYYHTLFMIKAAPLLDLQRILVSKQRQECADTSQLRHGRLNATSWLCSAGPTGHCGELLQ